LPEADKKVSEHFLGKIFLNKLVPHRRTRLDCSSFVAHPVWFIVRENPKDDTEKEMVESTPAFNGLLNEVYEKNGCVKFFHKDADTRILQNKDVIFTYGEVGEKVVQSLKNLGKKFQHHQNQIQ